MIHSAICCQKAQLVLLLSTSLFLSLLAPLYAFSFPPLSSLTFICIRSQFCLYDPDEDEEMMKHVLPYADGDRLDATKVTLFLFLFRALLFLHTRNAQTRTRTSRERNRTLNMPGTDRIISLLCPTCVLSKGLFVCIRLCYSYMHCKHGCIYGFRVGKIQKLNQLLYLIYIIQVSFYSCVCTFAIV